MLLAVADEAGSQPSHPAGAAKHGDGEAEKALFSHLFACGANFGMGRTRTCRSQRTCQAGEVELHNIRIR